MNQDLERRAFWGGNQDFENSCISRRELRPRGEGHIEEGIKTSRIREVSFIFHDANPLYYAVALKGADSLPWDAHFNPWSGNSLLRGASTYDILTPSSRCLRFRSPSLSWCLDSLFEALSNLEVLIPFSKRPYPRDPDLSLIGSLFFFSF